MSDAGSAIYRLDMPAGHKLSGGFGDEMQDECAAARTTLDYIFICFSD